MRLPSWPLRRSKILLIALLLAGLGATAVALQIGDNGTSNSPVVVVDTPLATPFKPDTTTLKSCRGDGLALMQCRQQALGNIAFQEGPDAAFSLLDEVSATAADGSFLADAHIVQHGIGRATLARLDGDVGQALAAGSRGLSTSGAGGYLHGVLLIAMGKTSRERLAATATKFCDSSAVRSDPSTTYWCLHGVGHGLMIYTGNRLATSLHGCDALDATRDRESCYVGVFMETYSEFQPMMDGIGAKSKYVTDRLDSPCNTVAKRYEETCYMQMMIRVRHAVDGDFHKIPPICRAVESRHIDTCYRATGTVAFDQGRGDPATVVQLCTLLEEGSPLCLAAAAHSVLGTHDPSGRKAAALCASATAETRVACYTSIGEFFATDGAQSQAQRCAKVVPATFLRVCATPPSDAPSPT